jgi:hypothetical protein
MTSARIKRAAKSLWIAAAATAADEPTAIFPSASLLRAAGVVEVAAECAHGLFEQARDLRADAEEVEQVLSRGRVVCGEEGRVLQLELRAEPLYGHIAAAEELAQVGLEGLDEGPAGGGDLLRLDGGDDDDRLCGEQVQGVEGRHLRGAQLELARGGGPRG